MFVDLAEGDVNRMNAFLVKTILDDVGHNFLDGNQEVISQATPDIVLCRETFEDGIHAQEILDPVFDRYADFRILHVAERRRDCSPARRKTCATSGATRSSPKLLPDALAVLLASMQRWTKAEAE